MFAPQRMAASVCPGAVPSRAVYCLRAATAIAPDGSTMLRVSMNTSLMAAHTASVSTVMNSSTSSRAMRKVSSPTCLTAVPSANRPTSRKATRSPRATDCAMASESFICTPMILISGRKALM